MPTGYTADIEKGISFKEYALGCARAFGALVTMRDDPSDAEIPDKFEPDSYHLDQMAKDNLRKQEVLNMTKLEAEQAAVIKYNEERLYHLKGIKEKNELRKKYNAMLQQAQSYKAPTPDHENFRKFMIEQIVDSIDFDCGGSYHEEALAGIEKLSGEKWRQKELDKLDKSIAYHREHYNKEKQRCKERTRWVQELKRSLDIEVKI